LYNIPLESITTASSNKLSGRPWPALRLPKTNWASTCQQFGDLFPWRCRRSQPVCVRGWIRTGELR